MAKWWMGVALSLLAMGVPAAARAQYLPVAGGAPPIQEPLPMSGPGGPPGPLPHPSDDPNCVSGPNAFEEEDDSDRPPCPAGWFLGVGSIGLRRAELPRLPLIFLDPQNLDTGNPPPPGSPLVDDVRNVATQTNWGVRATVGYRWGSDSALELSGFYLGQSASAHGIAVPGRLDLPFFNPPLGFEGDNGLWLQADRNVTTFETALGNAELNFRHAPAHGYGLEWLVGVRYLDLQERLSIFTDDDGLTVTPPDPTRMATYSVHTHNRLLGLQAGLDWERPVVKRVAVGAFVKGAWGPNFLDVDVSLTRGDGLIGSSGHRSNTIFGQVYEAGFFLDLYLTDHSRLRGGYNLLWTDNVAEAVRQVNFDLSQTVGSPNNNGSVFYHGPMVELQIAF